MKKFVLMVAMVVSCVCMAQNSHAQTGRDGNTDIDMLSMKNFYAIDRRCGSCRTGSDLQRL